MIREGSALLHAPHINTRGPGTIEGVFYNREMVFNRDTTIFLLHNVNVKTALDALSATGVRGIRMAIESGVNVTLNDRDRESYRIILENVKLNNLDCEVLNRDANAIMAERRFDYVDIDPFGTPVPFIDMALRSARILGVSATDTATLYGRHERIERRYLARIKGKGNHELGLRVLLGYIARMAARFDLGIEPVFSFWKGHAYRTYIRIRRGAGRAKKSLQYVNITEQGGPLWTGPLHDFEFLTDASIPELPTKKELEKYIELWKHENFFLYYEIPQLCSELGISQPPLQSIIDALKDAGYEAYRTQFSPQGVRTDAGASGIMEILRSLVSQHPHA